VKLRGWFPFALAVSLLGCTAAAPKREEPGSMAMSLVAEPAARATEGLVSAEFLPQYNSLLASGEIDGSQQLNVLIRLSATDDVNATARPDLDLAIVLDRSGSMSGDKLNHAKQAGIDLLAQLEPTDRVTLITYDDHVSTRVLARTTDRAGVLQLRNALLNVHPGGGTALGPALFEALDVLDVLERQDDGGRLSHVLLLSDGLANEGEQRPTVIAARVAQGYGHGTTVSTLGVGADYNEDLMALVADEGGGRYHFIEDAPQISKVLADELTGLASSVATDLSIELAAKAPSSVAEVHGYVSETEGRSTTVRVGYLASGQSREILARLDIPNVALRGQPGDEIELGTIIVRFRPVGVDDAPMVALELPARITLAGSAEQVESSERTEVTVRVAEIETAASLQAASQALERGDFAGAERIFKEADGALGASLEAATSEAERQRLRAELDALEAAQSSLKAAEQSGQDRKLVVKKYKEDAIKLGKGDSALGGL
jgi:Ca-activated chloride channel family protein